MTYTLTYLISSFGATTATRLSELLEGQVSHEQVTRMLAGTKQGPADLWQRVKPQVRKMESEAGVMIIDDSRGVAWKGRVYMRRAP